MQVLVIGRYFPPPRDTIHPLAQFNITYAYSIVSPRRRRCSRRNRKGLCTPGAAGFSCTGRTKAGPAQQFPPFPRKVRGRTKFPAKPGRDDDCAAIYRDLSRRRLPGQLARLVPSTYASRGTHQSAAGPPVPSR